MKNFDEYGASGPRLPSSPPRNEPPQSAVRDIRFSKKSLFSIWLMRRRTRRALAAMDDWQLRDIGLDRRAAMAEAAKPFWRA